LNKRVRECRKDYHTVEKEEWLGSAWQKEGRCKGEKGKIREGSYWGCGKKKNKEKRKAHCNREKDFDESQRVTDKRKETFTEKNGGQMIRGAIGRGGGVRIRNAGRKVGQGDRDQ